MGQFFKSSSGLQPPVALNNLATVTASRALASDASGYITQSAVTSTELGYVSGVTSSIQTQLNNKVDIVLAHYICNSSNATGTISSGTYTIIDFNESVVDTASAVTTGSGWKFTAPSTGYYEISAFITFSGAPDTDSYFTLYKNNSLVIDAWGIRQPPGDTAVFGIPKVISLAANDYIQVKAYQRTGSKTITVGGVAGTVTNQGYNFITIKKVG